MKLFFVGVAMASFAIAASSKPWSKADWLEKAFAVIQSKRYPRIRAMSYWHESWTEVDGPVDLRVNSSTTSLRAYRKGVKSPIFESTARFEGPRNNRKLVAPSAGCYLGAFANFASTEDEVSRDRINDFEQLTGRALAWVYFSNNWYDGIRFPKKQVQAIRDAGRIPFIRLMMRSREGGTPDPKYALQDFLDGKHDRALREWAEQAKGVGGPFILEFGTEVNGDWFPWNGRWNGGGRTDAFGDATVPDGPERFRETYRRIVRLVREANVPDVTWVYHVNAFSSPDESWNSFDAYYPGDEYVDWIGVSIYGPQKNTDDDYRDLGRVLDKIYPKLCSISSTKPLAVLEWGIRENLQKSRSH